MHETSPPTDQAAPSDETGNDDGCQCNGYLRGVACVPETHREERDGERDHARREH